MIFLRFRESYNFEFAKLYPYFFCLFLSIFSYPANSQLPSTALSGLLTGFSGPERELTWNHQSNATHYHVTATSPEGQTLYDDRIDALRADCFSTLTCSTQIDLVAYALSDLNISIDAYNGKHQIGSNTTTLVGELLTIPVYRFEDIDYSKKQYGDLFLDRAGTILDDVIFGGEVVIAADDVQIRNSTFLPGAGIKVWGDDAIIESNRFFVDPRISGIDIKLTLGKRPTVRNNYFTSLLNGEYIETDGGNDVGIYVGTHSAFSRDKMIAFGDMGTIVENNVFHNFYRKYHIHIKSFSNRIVGNRIVNDKFGQYGRISSRHGSRNIITKNTISNGLGYFIYEDDNVLSENKALSGAQFHVVAGAGELTRFGTTQQHRAHNTLVADNEGPLVIGYQWAGKTNIVPASDTLVRNHSGNIEEMYSVGTIIENSPVVDDGGDGGQPAPGVNENAPIELLLGQTDTGKYGNDFDGLTNSDGRVAMAFEADANNPLTLSMTGYDIDFDDEVAVLVNGTLLGYLSQSRNNELNGGQTLTIPTELLRNGANELVFQQTIDVSYKWGVTNVALGLEQAAPMPDPGVALLLGQTDTGKYGNDFDGLTNSDGRVAMAFEADANNPLTLSMTGYDIDFDDEVAVLVNGTLLGYLSQSRNNELNGGQTLTIPTELLRNGANELVFQQTIDVSYKWGVTNVALGLEQAAPMPDPGVALLLGQTDTGKYGNDFDGLTNSDGRVAMAFEADANNPLTLSMTGYDIDFDDEVAVLVNGTLLGYLSQSRNNELNGGQTLTIPTELLRNGANELVFQQTIDVSYKWGVTNVALGLEQAAPMPDPGVALLLGQTDTGKYGNDFDGLTNSDGRVAMAFEADANNPLTLSMTGYDIDFDDEVAVLVNGTLLGYLSQSRNNELNGGQTLTIPTELLRNGANELVFQQTIDVSYKWGVTNVALAWAKPPNSSIKSAFHADAGTTVRLSVTGFDIDTEREVAVMVNGVHIGYLRKGESDKMNGGQEFIIAGELVINGTNRLEFAQMIADNEIWGVTGINVEYIS